MKRIIILISLLIICLSLILSCSAFFKQNKDAFANLFPDNNVDDLENLLKNMPEFGAEKSTLNKLNTPMLVGVKLGKKQLFAYDIQNNKILWDSPEITINSRPIVTENVILITSDRKIVVLDLNNGSQKYEYEIPEGWSFRGGDANNGKVFIVLSKGNLSGKTIRSGKIIALNDSNGNQIWEKEAQFLLGDPSVYGNYIFVPWDGLNISVLSALDGRELCRLRTTDDIISFIHSTSEGIYYGGKRLYRLNTKSASGHKENSTYYESQIKGLPTEPEFYFNGFELPGLTAGRIRYYWKPQYSSNSEQIKFVDDTIYLVYFRYILAYQSDTGELKWTYRHTEDIEGATVIPGGIMIVGRHGIINFINNQTGTSTWTQEIGVPILSAILDVGLFTPQQSQVNQEPQNIRQNILSIITDPDNRLLPIRLYALNFLSNMELPEITQDLLDIYSLEGIPQQLKDAVSQALSARKSGASYLIDVLRTQNYDYLNQTKIPPLDVISKTLIKMEAREALPELISQLWNHETPLPMLKEVTSAIVELGDRSIIQPFKEFLLRYHADSTFNQDPEVISIVSRGILQYGDDADKTFITKIQNEQYTIEPVKQSIANIFLEIEKIQKQRQDAEKRAQDEAKRRLAEEDKRREEAIPRPNSLSQKEINEVMKTHFSEFRPCIEEAKTKNEKLNQIRFVFLITSEGDMIDFSIVPHEEDLLKCLVPKMKAIKFSKIRQFRQRARFTIQIAHPAQKQVTQEVPEGWGVSQDWGLPPNNNQTQQQNQQQQYPDQYPDQLNEQNNTPAPQQPQQNEQNNTPAPQQPQQTQEQQQYPDQIN